MVTAVTSAATPKHHHRPSQRPLTSPLIPNSDNAHPTPRRSKGREVSSRYLSLSTCSNSTSSTNTTSSSRSSSSSLSSISISSSCRRSQSPMLSSRATAITTPKSSLQQRSASADRSRCPVAAATTPSNAERMMVNSMRRSLSMSFQGDSYKAPVSKVKPPPVVAVGTPGGLRKGTPERRKTTPVRDRENARPMDQQRWPGRLRGGDNSSFMSRSLDYGGKRVNLTGSNGGLRKSVASGEGIGKKLDSRLKVESNAIEIRTTTTITKQIDSRRIDLNNSFNSDVGSVSSRTSESGSMTKLKLGPPRALVVPPRKVLDPASPMSSNLSNRTILAASKKFQNDSPISSPHEVFSSRGLSPLRSGVRPASPNRTTMPATGSVSRGISSPLRARGGGLGNSMNDSNVCSTPSMLSFATDARRGKFGESRIADAHELRLLYNRQLQWRLANAKVENALLVQKHTAERSLYNAWVTTSKLQYSVKSKRIELQLLRHNLKLYAILREQEPHLESWDLLDKDHCNSLSGAIVALEASTVRLPVTGGARADLKNVQETMSSAVDVMQAMASSICSLLTKVEQMNLLVSELSTLRAREHRLLDECKDLLSTTFIPLQVMHCSLRTHVLQVQSIPASFTKKV